MGGKHEDIGGGMRGSDADPMAPAEDRKFRKDVRVSTTNTVDEAATLRAQGFVLEQREAAARHGLTATTDTLGKSLGWLAETQGKLAAAHTEIARLQAEVGRLQSRKQKDKKAKFKAKAKIHAIDQRSAVIKHAITTLAPGALHLAPKIALLADRYLPTVLAAAASGDATPQAALIRLFLFLNDDDPESLGAQLRETLERECGPEDWKLIQQMLVELAASSPAAKVSGTSYVNGAVSSSEH